MLNTIQNKKLLLKRGFIFKAHHGKGYEKLRENQFASAEHGLVHEPVANALDEHQGNKPICITLKKKKNLYVLSFHDNGKGLQQENLNSLHFIGQSSKKKKKENTIGRFGMGLVGAFNSKIGVQSVEIKTLVCGKAARILYDCSRAGIPTWRMKELNEPCSGFKISFSFPASSHRIILKALTDFLKDNIVPVEFNGKIYCVDPSAMAGKKDISVKIEQNPKVYYAAHPFSNNWVFTDDIQLYLRKMLVEKGTMYPMFVTTSGSKLPQNFYHYDTPYMQDESCIIVSETGEPTLGRDKLVRNEDFNTIKKNVETARCLALVELFERARASALRQLRHYADNMATANIYAMRSLLVKKLKQDDSFMETKGHCAPLLEALLQYPLFSIFEDKNPLSITDILSFTTKENVVLYAETPDAHGFLRGSHNCPFVLKEKVCYIDDLWGGHEYRRIETILKPLLESAGLELVSMDELLWNEKKCEDLEEREILFRSQLKIKHLTSPDQEITDFLDRLKTLLNRNWFRHSLVRFHPPRKIRILPISVEKQEHSGEIVAAVLNGTDADPDELNIGICMDSLPMRSILKKNNAEIAALPVICHELTHHRRKLVDDMEEQGRHSDSFHLDRIQLETNVLKNCTLHLLGKDEELSRGCQMGMLSDVGEILVL
ncbi:Histidine kinase-, DNA gyrase B-, and HSP90-like ATPase [Desulfocicer vacuolatum DSM 3385]|uniref:Histidine kinase-, DNA gyrase B-, and HSP90-like ATPase n=1 Tax=Desulfocicer vacuolatum DSM 3385 TaxID=1121400 RepID=A0A1W2DRV4_9BACT|nr:ATP-binding protein [Desulfocicer vacuolatum]SMD00265.1 Histidine kinase-, DNA gyrase B-, and HSP90-like ATPase [Desulfocicer vacuolatum DSM 3385]